MASSNVTRKIVLCYAPADAQFKPPLVVLADAINLTAVAGAKGLIFAQYNFNLLEVLTRCEGIMPCVLVDFEIAQRILSYMDITG